jgi:anti-sigma factor RsiW
MNHESYRELLALRLYGELDGADRALVDEHLKTCADCRALAGELESGLGALRAARIDRGADEIPADWRERLRRSTIAASRSVRLSPFWSAAAAFAAGILLATVLAHRSNDRSGDPSGDLVARSIARNDGAHPLSIYERFNGSMPPPSASTDGQLARLSEYWKR